MYIPEAFAMNGRAACHDAIRASSFGTLVTSDPSGLPVATHLPFLLDAERGAHGTLVGHLARANPQWQALATGRPVLAIFQGPHAYVSPAWYEVHPAVPTWNYLAVHAEGVPRLLSDPAAVAEVLRRLVDTSEAAVGSSWRMESLDDAYRAEMIPLIAAFEIPISRLEGKAKLSQNRSAADRVGVIAALERSTEPGARAVAAAMRATPEP